MAIAVSQKMSLEDFLVYDDGTDYLYELENGELVRMPSESEINRRIAMFLVSFFLGISIPTQRLSMKTELEVSGQRATVRIPDLVLFSEDLAIALQGASRSIVRMDMPPPELIVEIVSPKQENRDYRYKRSEYAARGITEYWIIDPNKSQLLLLEWVEGLDEEPMYSGDKKIGSPLFGELDLDVARIMSAGA
ncbi:MAG: Uma2 family endonuclease [Cyanobacteria bacterium P01_F01_bin.42]